uniref:PHD-type domain-containing protein n=1 Tax=Taeniopygia guttata TaxID=59729 RepID=A0A674GGB6_TAEGU
MEPSGGGLPPQNPPKPPQIGEGQDVLAPWTDGLLYLGVVKKVDAPRRGCLIQFEDNSKFSLERHQVDELWAVNEPLINALMASWRPPAAEPGDDPSCCVCAGNSRNAENSLVRCGKCGHAYHQRCHVPPAPGGAAPWSCRRCVFAVATKVSPERPEFPNIPQTFPKNSLNSPNPTPGRLLQGWELWILGFAPRSQV